MIQVPDNLGALIYLNFIKGIILKKWMQKRLTQGYLNMDFSALCFTLQKCIYF